MNPSSAPPTGPSSSASSTSAPPARKAGIKRPLENPAAPTAATRATILVHPNQKGNPVLEHIQNAPYVYDAQIPTDYIVGRSTSILFLSLRYHRLHPDYIYERTKRQPQYTLRLLLVQVDVDDPQATLRDLTQLCLAAGLTLVLAWSPEEAGRYIETFKSYECKPPDAIRPKVEETGLARASAFLTAVKGVNRTDVVTLLSAFGSLRGVLNAEGYEVGLLPGFGERKVRRLCGLFKQAF